MIQALNKIMGINVDVSELIEKGEGVRLAMRDMMRRTQSELARMRKSHEYDIPGLLYQVVGWVKNVREKTEVNL